MKTILDELCEITPQRDLFEVAAECDIVYGYINRKDVLVTVVEDPFYSGLQFTKEHKKPSMVILERHFTKIYPDARWMRALRIYQLLQEQAQGVV